MSTSKNDPVLVAIEALGQRMAEMERRLKADIAEVKGDVAVLRTDMEIGFADVKKGLGENKDRIEAVNETMASHFAEPKRTGARR